MANEKNKEKELTLGQQKLVQLQDAAKEMGIEGLQFIDAEGRTFARSAFLIEGQELPMAITVDETVYTYIQVGVVPKVKEDARAKVLEYINLLNINHPMLQYSVTPEGQVVLQMSVIFEDDAFKPALIFALIEEVVNHLMGVFPEIMKEVWA